MRRAASLAFVFVALWTIASTAAAPQLKYVVILSRHGVRAPTWEADRLKQYSAEPWPDFGVAPGYLTTRGRTLMTLMGRYYGEWLARERVIERRTCVSAKHVFVWADTDQRTLETGHALAEGLLPKCAIAVHSQEGDADDPLFNGPPELNGRGVAPQLPIPSENQAALRTLQGILTGGGIVPNGKLTLNTASTLSENLLLEYGNGFRGKDLGWGRLNAGNLLQALELHTLYAELTRRTPALARARGSNLLSGITASMEQAATGKPVPRALGAPDTAVLIISGHDTNISNLSGMLRLSWTLPGYQPDDTPPGGALVFSLWRDPDGQFVVRSEYLAQTLDQMQAMKTLTLSVPPASQAVAIPGCGKGATDKGCPWPMFERAVQHALQP